MFDEEGWRDRYSRQIALGAFGPMGQQAVEAATVMVVGAGGLGTNSVELLARMGVGDITVIDHDMVERSNLHRTRVFGVEDVGRPKVEVLAERIAAIVGENVVEPVHERFGPDNALSLLEDAEVVLDGLDNMRSRFLLNDACQELMVPWVYGGVLATGGMVVPFQHYEACLRCIFPELPDEETLPSTTTHGVHPSLPALVASVQVSHATRIILEEVVEPTMLAFDLWSDEWRMIEVKQREDCPCCVQGRRDFLWG